MMDIDEEGDSISEGSEDEDNSEEIKNLKARNR
jgi:hypothetical protein